MVFTMDFEWTLYIWILHKNFVYTLHETFFFRIEIRIHATVQSQSFNSPESKLSIPVDLRKDNNSNSFCTNNTEIYKNLKVIVIFGGDFGVITPSKICK